MTLYEFIASSETEQAAAVWDGIFLADRREEEHRILLYQIDSFYVEVYYNEKQNRIDRFRPFASTELLQPYLHHIDLSVLIS